MPCSEAGISFAGVHDSFWTHAGHVPAMNRLLRAKFVELHAREVRLLCVRSLETLLLVLLLAFLCW